MGEQQLEHLVTFFKALADASRLRIVGVLAQREATGEELAAVLGLHAGTISHHMTRLTQSGLVSGHAAGYYTVYRLNVDALNALAKRLLSNDSLVTAVDDLDVNAFDKKVVKDFTGPAGKLRSIPAQRKKRSAVLRHIVQHLTPERRYSEKQLNNILKRFHLDTATLRREMIAEKLLAREKGEYWLTEPQG